MAKKSEKRYGSCQNNECMNYGMSEIIPDDGNCPICHKPMKPEDESLESGNIDLDNLDELEGDTKVTTGGNDPWWKKPIVLIAAAVLLVAGIGYGIYAVVSGMGGSKIKGIKLDKKELTLKVGERDLLTATPDPADAKATFIWKSSDKSVVDVVGGELTALKKGKATITVKVEENAELRAVTCKVEVKEAKTDDTDEEKETETKETLITSLSINSSDFTLKVGESKTLAYQATPEKNDENVSWSTSDPKVATVSASGEVKAVGAGTATITALSDKSAKDASVKVTVPKKETTTTGGGGNDNRGGTTVAQPTSGTLKLSYGTYTGQIKNGYPNGQGRLVYNRSRQINKYDSKGRTANPGDVVQGTFVNGFFTIGKHYDSAGNLIESLNVGTVDGVYESK